MASSVQQRIRLDPDLWAAVEAVAASKRVPASSIVDEALRSYFGPRQDLADAARVIDGLLIDRAGMMDKINILFAATFGNQLEDS